MTINNSRGPLRIEIKPGAVVFVVAMALLARLYGPALFAMLASVVAHEGAHWLVSRHYRVSIRSVGANILGPFLGREFAPGRVGVLIALAGPTMSLALALSTGGIVSRFNWALFVVNLLPIPGSDGLHALRAMRAPAATPNSSKGTDSQG